jgi:hypothetical protein
MHQTLSGQHSVYAQEKQSMRLLVRPRRGSRCMEEEVKAASVKAHDVV